MPSASEPSRHNEDSRIPSARRRVPSVRQGPLPAPSVVARLADLSLPHVESFSYFCDAGLAACVRDIPAREYTTASGPALVLPISAAVSRDTMGCCETQLAQRSSVYTVPLSRPRAASRSGWRLLRSGLPFTLMRPVRLKSGCFRPSAGRVVSPTLRRCTPWSTAAWGLVL